VGFVPVPDSQHLRGAPATIAVTWTDQYGEPSAVGGAVTVRVQSADGTDVVSAGSSTVAGGDVGVYTRALTAAQTASLALLTATWTDAASGATRTTYHELVGGFYFSVATARAFDDKITTDLANDARVRAVRQEVETECELITGVAWVPRYARVTVSGADDVSIVLPNAAIRSVRSVRTYDQTMSSYTAFTVAQLVALAVYDDGIVTRTDGNVFDAGVRNMVVELEHGRERLPADLQHATLTRLRSRLYMEKTGIPDRATTYTPAEGGTFAIAQPGLYSTGLPEVDAVYSRYSLRRTRIAGRVVDYDPQRNSLFHGGPQ
jgi:hypothetical protein